MTYQCVFSGCEFEWRRPPSSALRSLLAFLFLFEQDGADAVDIARHHGQGDVALETVDAVVRTHIQAVHFESVDRRLDRRVRAPGLDELRRVLDFLCLLRNYSEKLPKTTGHPLIPMNKIGPR